MEDTVGEMEMKGEDTEMKIEETISKDDNTAPRFEIKKWNAVTMWSWDICADTCAICRNSLNEPSIEYQVLFSCVFRLFNIIIFLFRQTLHQITRMVLV